MATKKEILIFKIKEKIKQDPSFKKRLLANSKAALEELLDTKVPQNLDIEILEDNPKKIHLVLDNEPLELQEKELAQVAGGFCLPNVVN